jgi:hypothetical protein
MVDEAKRPSRGWGGRYVGPRVNCESVPCLPAAAVAWMLNDPRKVPYLMVWKDDRSGGLIEAVRVARYSVPDNLDWPGWVEIKRTNGMRSVIRTVERSLPRNGGKARLLTCPRCQRPRGALYAWEVNRTRTHSVRVATWQCRTCAGLRYSSEGAALAYRPRSGLGKALAAMDNFTRHPRPEPCYPYVFVNPVDAEAILPGR